MIDTDKKHRHYLRQISRTLEFFSAFNEARINNQLNELPERVLCKCDDQVGLWDQNVSNPKFRYLVKTDVAFAEQVLQVFTLMFHYKHMKGHWTDIVNIWPQLYRASHHNASLLHRLELLRQTAVIHNNMGKYSEAQLVYWEILANIEPHEEQAIQALKAETLFHLGASLVDEGQNEEALPVLEDCAAVSYAINDLFTYGYALQQQANALLQMGCIAEAEQIYKNVLHHWLEIGQEQGLVHVTYYGLGKFYFFSGRYEEAVDVLMKALHLKKYTSEPEESIANCQCLLGRALSGAGRYQEAKEHLEEALSMSQSLADVECEINALVGIAEICRHHDKNVITAFKNLEAAFALLNQASPAHLKIQTLWQMIIIQARLRKFNSAARLTLALIQTLRAAKLGPRRFARFGYLFFTKRIRL